MMVRLFLLLLLAGISEAYTTFDTSCTIPNQTTNFIRSPDSRGTLDILWTCLFTIFACTWTVQHLNVPEQRNGRDPGWKGDVKWKIKSFWRSLKWMMITIIAPEVLIAKFWQDLAIARVNLPFMRKLAARERVEWTLTHSLFADMGGFVIIGNTGRAAETLLKTNMGLASVATSKLPLLDDMEQELILRPSQPEVLESGATPQPESNPVPHHDPFHLSTFDIYQLHILGYLSKLPHITIDEINDKSKSDAFARIVSILQIGWIVTQVIIRAAKNIAISPLEEVVVAFSASAILIYALAWFKPKDVSTPFTLMSFPNAIPSELIKTLQKLQSKRIEASIFSLFFDYEVTIKSGSAGAAFSNDENPPAITDNKPYVDFIGVVIGCFVFGGLHLTAWNFKFLTGIESTLWRVTSAYCTFFPILVICVFIMFSLHDRTAWLFSQSLRMISVIYVLCRLFLLVEMFRTLFLLPPDAFRTY